MIGGSSVRRREPVWVRLALLALVVACAIPVARAEATPAPAPGSQPAPEAEKPPLLQPADFTTRQVPLGSPSKAKELYAEMKHKWDGMQNPLNTPWEQVWTKGNGGGNLAEKGPSSLVGTPEDPFTPKFGPWRAGPRGLPPPQMYDTFLFDPKNPFKRAFQAQEASDATSGPGVNGGPEHEKFWHPLMGVKSLESTSFPRVVVPVPRPLYRNKPRNPVPGARPRDWTYEHVPARPQITRDDAVPFPRRQPMAYEYPSYHVLNPRSAFTRSNPHMNYHSFGEKAGAALLEEDTMTQAEEGETVLLQEAEAEKGTVQDLVQELAGVQGLEKAEETPEPMVYHFYPMGRKGPALFRGQVVQKRFWDEGLAQEAEMNAQKTQGRQLSIAQSGDPPGPYGHGYNHQAGAPAGGSMPTLELTSKEYDNTKTPDETLQVQDRERQSDDAKKLSQDPRLPYLGTQGKQEPVDYKMTAEPPLEGFVGSAGKLDAGVQTPYEEAIRKPESGRPTPVKAGIAMQDHAFNLPAARGAPTKAEFTAAHPNAKEKYADHYPEVKSKEEETKAAQPNPMPAQSPMSAGPPMGHPKGELVEGPENLPVQNAYAIGATKLGTHDTERTGVKGVPSTQTPFKQGTDQQTAEKSLLEEQAQVQVQAAPLEEPHAARPPKAAFVEMANTAHMSPAGKLAYEVALNKGPRTFVKAQEGKAATVALAPPADAGAGIGAGNDAGSLIEALAGIHNPSVTRMQNIAVSTALLNRANKVEQPSALIEQQDTVTAEHKSSTADAEAEAAPSTPWWEQQEAVKSNAVRVPADTAGTVHMPPPPAEHDPNPVELAEIAAKAHARQQRRKQPPLSAWAAKASSRVRPAQPRQAQQQLRPSSSPSMLQLRGRVQQARQQVKSIDGSSALPPVVLA